MEIVTGDRYLEYLVKFVEKQAGPLLEGTLVLKLNPVGLHYVQSRLEALQELEALLAGAPVDYLRAYISDLGDHRALEQLRRILCLLTSLKLVSVLPPPIRDPTPLSLLPFGRLKVLELRGCDLSTSAARGLLELRHTLEKIICHNSTDALRHVFASRIVDIKESPVWNKLSIISCACNGLVLMDESLQLLPAVEILDLSRNKFSKVDNLCKCTKLKHLDLGFNHLRSISLFNEVTCSIVKLVLRSNALTTLCGIENLKSLEGLDLSFNIISNISELEILGTLPSLRSLLLEGNPLCCIRWYREQVFSLFTHPENLKLDEKRITTRESLKRQIILASRQKRPAGFGFYSPAKHNVAEGEGVIDTKRRRPSRLAMIEDDKRKSFLADAAEQDSISYDSEIQSREENAISDGETEIVDLMNRVESMKKECSVLWLREFKEWMDQTLVENAKLPGLIGPGDDNYMKKERPRKHLEESLGYLAESVHDSGDEDSTSILELDNSSATAFIGSHVYQHFTCGEPVSESSMVERSGDGRTDLDSGKTHLKQLHLKDAANASLLLDASTDYRSDKRSARANGMLVTAIDDIMESRSSSAYPGSPPHYQEDILHRRHNLEEEFMLLSAESYSLASSDSDTSSSDEDLCNSETSVPMAYQLSNDQFLNRIKDGHLGVPLFERSYGDTRHESSTVRPNGRTSFDSCADHTSRVEEQDHINTADELTVAATHDNDNAKNQDEEHLEKRKGKRRSKKRVVSLSEDNCEAGYPEPLSQKQNGLMAVAITDLEDERQIQSLGGRNLQDIFCDSIHFMETTSDLRIDESIKNYFQENVADNGISEICLQTMLCDCVIQKESDYRESKVVILLSSVNKIYVLLLDNTSDGSGIILEVVGCHRLEEIKEVAIGIGLQILRVHIEMDCIYLFITKSIERSRKLLSLLHVCDSSSLSTYSLKSLEHEQVELFEKHICRGSSMNIFMYSMLLFWSNNNEEESWLSRSLFVIEGYMFVCVEDFAHLSSVTSDDALSSSYFLLDSCYSICSISEMVIEPRETRCLTLTINGTMSEKFNPSGGLGKEKIVTKLEEKMVTGSTTWKLKWFSEETLVKFVVLLKALHAATSISPLPVRCNS